MFYTAIAGVIHCVDVIYLDFLNIVSHRPLLLTACDIHGNHFKNKTLLTNLTEHNKLY